jgi:hypothetical protein
LSRRTRSAPTSEARRAGHREIRLYTNDRTARNLALYRSCGFVESGRRAHPTRPGMTLVDLAKPLGP